MSKTKPANACTYTQAAILQALKNTFSDLNLYAGRQCQGCGGEQFCLHT